MYTRSKEKNQPVSFSEMAGFGLRRGARIPQEKTCPVAMRSVTTAVDRLVALGLSKGPFQFPPLKGSTTSLAPNYAGRMSPDAMWQKNVEKFPIQTRQLQPQKYTPYKGARQSASTSSGLTATPARRHVLPSVPNPRPPARKPKYIPPPTGTASGKGRVGRASASASNTTSLSNSVASTVTHLDKSLSHQQQSPKKSKPSISPSEMEEATKLKLELHRSRLDNEASDRRIARLLRKVEELEYTRDEAESLKMELDELDDRLHAAVLENSDLKKKLGLEGRGKDAKDGFTKEDRTAYVVKIKELNKRIEALTGNYKSWMKQLKDFQHEFMDALGITDADLARNVANGGIGESSKSCGSVKLHGFLRTCVENLKSEYNGAASEVITLRSQLHQEIFKADGLSKELETLQAERKRSLEGFREHESQIEYLSNEIKLLRSFLNDELSKETEAQIKGLQKENEELSQSLIKLQGEHDTRVAKLHQELEYEQDRYEQLETLGVEERKEIEMRWKKLWEVHSYRMKEDFETLKKNYENPLVASHERETGLQKQLDDLHARYNKSKEAWEDYRLTLFDQLEQWKEQYVLKCSLLEELRQERGNFDVAMNEKQKDIELYQKMLNDGVEERQNLQKKVEALQTKLRELIGLGKETIPAPPDGETSINLSSLCSTRSWFSIGDFKKMKEKMQTKSQSLLAAHEEDKEKKKLHC